MNTALLSLLVISCFELLMWQILWRWRRLIGCGLIIVLSLASGWLVGQHVAVWTILLLVISAYRIINLLRVLQKRLAVPYLRPAGRRASYWLISVQVVIYIVGLLGINNQFWYYLLAVSQLIIIIGILIVTLKRLASMRLPNIESTTTDRDLPSVSVCVPARNETTDLEACLQSLIASDYPKLEIIVLDDCSQNQRTPEIIRSFAQHGVRFISGHLVPDHWLAKNYAYQQLMDQANGQLLLFCGVDTRFEPRTIRQLVNFSNQTKRTMISLLPWNNKPVSPLPLANLSQPNRYAWQLAVPRFISHHQPVLSTCWLAHADLLQANGGFAAVNHSILPETYFAKAAAAHNQYRFITTNSTINVISQKVSSEQRATMIRTRYPQLHRRLELVLMVSLIEVGLFTAPLMLLVEAIIQRRGLLEIICLVGYAIAVIWYGIVRRVTYRQRFPIASWLMLVAALYDIWLMNCSLWQYEFGEVIWKGRNVCLPVMQVIPALPALSDKQPAKL